jgi:hypothetical protein
VSDQVSLVHLLNYGIFREGAARQAGISCVVLTGGREPDFFTASRRSALPREESTAGFASLTLETFGLSLFLDEK